MNSIHQCWGAGAGKKLQGAGAVKPYLMGAEKNPGSWEPVKEIYKSGSKESEAGTFLEGAGAESR